MQVHAVPAGRETIVEVAFIGQIVGHLIVAREVVRRVGAVGRGRRSGRGQGFVVRLLLLLGLVHHGIHWVGNDVRIGGIGKGGHQPSGWIVETVAHSLVVAIVGEDIDVAWR